MKKFRNKIFMSIIGILLIYSLFITNSYAENKTETNNKTNTTNSESSENTTTDKKDESSNANLANLGIRPYDFSGFKYGTKNYEVKVPANTEKVEGTGTINLEKGKNKAEVIVTAEDGTKNTYTINIIRGEDEDNQDTDETKANNEKDNDSEEENKDGLRSLKINDLALSPEFKTGVYEYTVKYIGEDAKLNIKAEPTELSYDVEIVGNEELKEGENTITILVSDKNGDNVATYQVTVNKSLVDEEAVAREEAKKKEQQRNIIIGGVVAVVILGIIIYFIIRHRRNSEYAEEYSGVPFYGLNKDDEEYDDYYEDDDEDIQEYEEDLPKALSKHQKEDDDDIEGMRRDELREKFLNNYNSTYDEDGENLKRGKHKGKRFK